MTSSSIEEGIAKSLENVLLGTSIWGVLDITQMKRRYKIIGVVSDLIEKEHFKKLGFSIRLIDNNFFVQKIPFFENNNDFIEKHELFFNDEPSYPAYLEYMYHNKKKHE